MLFRLFGSASVRYTKRIASLKLRHKEHNNDPYALHNNTINLIQWNETTVHILTSYIKYHPCVHWPLEYSRDEGYSPSPRDPAELRKEAIFCHIVFTSDLCAKYE